MSFWDGRKVLITGSSGFIGSYLARALLHAGAEVTGLDLQPHSPLQQSIGVPSHEGIQGNILDSSIVRRAVRGKEACFHLAANSGVNSTRENGLSALELNIMGTLSVLDACREAETGAVLVATSNHIYGDHGQEMVDEQTPLLGLGAYSASKVCADHMTRAYAYNYGMATVAVRNTNCYGPYDPHHDHIIPGTILALRAGEPPVIRGTGQTKKAYLYIEDVVRAYMLLGEHILSGGQAGFAVNVSTGSASVLDLVRIIMDKMGRHSEPIILANELGQHDEFLDSSLMRKLTGWREQYSLAEGVQLTAESFRSVGAVPSGVGNHTR